MSEYGSGGEEGSDQEDLNLTQIDEVLSAAQEFGNKKTLNRSCKTPVMLFRRSSLYQRTVPAKVPLATKKMGVPKILKGGINTLAANGPDLENPNHCLPSSPCPRFRGTKARGLDKARFTLKEKEKKSKHSLREFGSRVDHDYTAPERRRGHLEVDDVDR